MIDFSLRALEQLIAVVDESSFTRAAAQLNVAQPWLSARIRRLEETAGLRLLDRSTRNIRPTPEGEAFVAQARIVLSEARRLARLATGSDALRIGAAPYTYFLADRQALIEGFAASHSTIAVEIENGQDPDLRQAVLQDKLHAAIVTGPAPAGCDALVLERRHLVAMVPVEHPLAALSAVPFAMLSGEKVAAYRRSANPIAWDATVRHLGAAGAQIVTLPEPMRRALIDVARRDRLILAVLGTFDDDLAGTGHPEEADALVTRPVVDPDLGVDITLVRRSLDRPRPALDRFWEHATAVLAANRT